MPVIYLGVFLLSASLLALEIVWIRLLDFQQWAHVSSLVISVALLGFTASGPLVATLRRRPHPSWGRVCRVLVLLYALGVPLSFLAVQQLPLDPFRILWEAGQGALLLGCCLLLFVPFLLGASAVGLLFCDPSLRVSRLYFFHVGGSGLGVVAALGLLSLLPPRAALFWVALAGDLASTCFPTGGRNLRWIRAGTAAAVLLPLLLGRTQLAVYPNKPLARDRGLPGVAVREERASPWGTVHLLSGPPLRSLPGLSLRYEGPVPRVEVLYLDADTVGSRLPLPAALGSSLDFFSFLIQSLPYRVLEAPRVLVTGAGAGMDVLSAFGQGAASVSVLEPHPAVLGLLRPWLEQIREQRFPDRSLHYHGLDLRGFLRGGRQLFDLIVINRMGSPASSLAGVYGFHGDYDLTLEGVRELFAHLDPEGGVLAISLWLEAPPRSNLRLFATIIEMLRTQGIPDPGRHLFVARGWSVCTTLVCRAPFSEAGIALLRDFCRERDFDRVYYPGMPATEANRHHVLDRPHYHEAIVAMLGPERDSYIGGHPFDIAPVTDDRPYFHHYLRWRTLPRLWRQMGRDWLLLREWGFLASGLSVLVCLALGVLVLILPALARRALRGRSLAPAGATGRRLRLLYFALVGSGFMVLEMLLLERCSFFLSYPLLSIAVVLAAILVFSSLGGLTVDGWLRLASPGTVRTTACLLLAAAAAATALFPGLLFEGLLGSDLWVRALVILLLLGPVFFLMGIPFPSALREVREHRMDEVPACWGINGWASVCSTAIAPLLAMTLGLRAALLVGAGLYLLAAFLSPFLGGSFRGRAPD